MDNGRKARLFYCPQKTVPNQKLRAKINTKDIIMTNDSHTNNIAANNALGELLAKGTPLVFRTELIRRLRIIGNIVGIVAMLTLPFTITQIEEYRTYQAQLSRWTSRFYSWSDLATKSRPNLSDFTVVYMIFLCLSPVLLVVILYVTVSDTKAAIKTDITVYENGIAGTGHPRIAKLQGYQQSEFNLVWDKVTNVTTRKKSIDIHTFGVMYKCCLDNPYEIQGIIASQQLKTAHRTIG